MQINCENESDIDEYFKDKFFLMLSNQVRFVQDDFSENKVVRESIIKKLKISTQMRQTYAFRASMTQLGL